MSEVNGFPSLQLKLQHSIVCSRCHAGVGEKESALEKFLGRKRSAPEKGEGMLWEKIRECEREWLYRAPVKARSQAQS